MSVPTRSLQGSVRPALEGALTDTQIVDWLEIHSLLHWPFGNEIQVSARCLAAVPFTARPTLREAVQAAITAQPNAELSRPASQTSAPAKTEEQP